MGTKDTITKDYMADNRVFADVFNHMLYKGKNVIDPDTLHPLDTTALAVQDPRGPFSGSRLPDQSLLTC